MQAIRDPDPEQLVSALARAKAAAIRARLPPSDDLRVLITCDQGACNSWGKTVPCTSCSAHHSVTVSAVVVCGGSILEKPADAEQVRCQSPAAASHERARAQLESHGRADDRHGAS